MSTLNNMNSAMVFASVLLNIMQTRMFGLIVIQAKYEKVHINLNILKNGVSNNEKH